MIPVQVGSIAHQTSTQLAEAAIGRMSKRYAYGVAIDPSGHVIIGMPDDFHARELLGVFTRTSDPDELADNLRHEIERRNPQATRRRKAG